MKTDTLRVLHSGYLFIHPRTFRHSFAINSVRHGVDIRRLQQVLGHSNINTMAVYLQFNDKDVQEAYGNVPF
jgi:integrase/recombinase XerD